MTRKNRKLTNEQARSIRHLYKDGATMQRLAAAYGVSVTTIHKIVTGQWYKLAGGPRVSVRYGVPRRRREEMLAKHLEFIVRARATGLTYKEIAGQIGVSCTFVRNVCVNYMEPWQFELAKQTSRKVKVGVVELYPALAVKELHLGLSVREIAKKYKLEPHEVEALILMDITEQS